MSNFNPKVKLDASQVEDYRQGGTPPRRKPPKLKRQSTFPKLKPTSWSVPPRTKFW